MKVNLSCASLFGKESVVFLAFFMVFFSAFSVLAEESPVNRLQSPEAQRLTVQALKDMDKDRWEAARDKIAQSRDPLAAKVYHWMLLTNARKTDWTTQMFMRLSQFIRQNPEWPSISKMKVNAEGVMPENLSNAEVLAWYNDFPPQTPYGMERYVDALIIEGKRDPARSFLTKWWADTNTSRDQQREIFKKFGNYLTVDAHKRRFDALLYNGNYENARAIAAVLGQGYPELAEARYALAENKGSINALIDRVPAALQKDAGLLYERLKWRRKRNMDDGAIEILQNAPDEKLVRNPEDWWKERHIMIRRLLEKQQYKKAYVLASGHIQEDGFSYAEAQWLAGWLALQFMNKPTDAYERFTALFHKVETPVSKARAAYWSGRAAKALKQEELAQNWFKSAAQFQTVFYGQLAAGALSIDNKLPESKLPQLTKGDLETFQKNELIQAYKAFKSASMPKTADVFLTAFLDENESPKTYRYVAELLADSGDSYGALRVAKKATRKGLFLTKQSYPVITDQMGGIQNVEWALVHALIRQESMFDKGARSPAGALGLMQLMPSTAREVSQKLGTAYQAEWLTARPNYNILLGSTYIDRLLRRYDGSYPLAIAAYNAGPGRVDSWIKIFGDPRQKDINLIDWIEMIPIYETRNYVQRVMEGVHVYRLRLKSIPRQPIQKHDVAIKGKP